MKILVSDFSKSITNSSSWIFRPKALSLEHISKPSKICCANANTIRSEKIWKGGCYKKRAWHERCVTFILDTGTVRVAVSNTVNFNPLVEDLKKIDDNN